MLRSGCDILAKQKTKQKAKREIRHAIVIVAFAAESLHIPRLPGQVLQLSHDIVLCRGHSHPGKGRFWDAQSQERAEKNVMNARPPPPLLFKEHA